MSDILFKTMVTECIKRGADACMQSKGYKYLLNYIHMSRIYSTSWWWWNILITRCQNHQSIRIRITNRQIISITVLNSIFLHGTRHNLMELTLLFFPLIAFHVTHCMVGNLSRCSR